MASLINYITMIRNHFNNKLILLALLTICCQAQIFAYKTHHVVSGESLWGISNKYNITVEQLIAANPSLEKGLKADTYIRIPEDGDLSFPENKSVASSSEVVTQSHIVRINRDHTATSAPQETPELSDVIESQNAYYSPHNPENTTDYNSTGYYISSFGDSFISISRKTNVPVDLLVHLNPFIDGATIPEGTLIRISSLPISNVEGRNLTFIDSVELRIHYIPTIVERKQKENSDIIVVALPFETETNSLSKQSLLATEFYKGLLLAVNNHISSGNISPMKIVAIDTKNGVDNVIRQINDLALNSSSIIIPADDETILSAIAKSGTDATVLNVLSIRDNSYTDNDRVVQCNINQPLMYDKAATYIIDKLSGYTPVILNPAGGATEKSGFTDLLRKKCQDEGIEVIELNFSNKLTDKDLARLHKDKKYVFIPKSGNTDVFERFASALSDYFATDMQYDRLKLFGYPDWVVLKGNNETALHEMNAIIYSRFYLDEQNIFTKDILDSYEKWYGAPMAKAFPVQAMLGYDAGNLIIHANSRGWKESAIDRLDSNSYEGHQSAFHFTHDNSKGLINDALYIIEFLPGETCIISVI